MEFGPIWRASLRNKTGALLVVLQVAFTLALIVNAVAIADRQAEQMSRPSGIDEPNSFHLRSSAYESDFNARATIEDDLRRIRAMPGVVAAIQMNSVPISGGGMGMGLKTVPDEAVEQVGTGVYMVDEHAIDALGLSLVAGQNFTAADVKWQGTGSPWPSRTILSKSLAELLFPDDPSLGVGQVVYIDQSQPMTVAGVVEKLQAAWPGWNNVENTILVPQHPSTNDALYFVRAEPGRRDALMPTIEETLTASEPGRIIQDMRTMEQTRERTFDANGALVNILVFTVAILVAITSLGVAGLTSFNITRRYKQIGVRRALGASSGQILRYFLAENLLFTLIGIVVGAALAVGINSLLVEAFSVPRFSWLKLPLAMAGLVVLSQLAVFLPARRAAQVPPAVATRTV